MDLPARGPGVLVIRIWAEGPHPEELRARLRATPDVTSDAGREWAVAGRPELLDAVAEWVDAYLEAGPAAEPA